MSAQSSKSTHTLPPPARPNVPGPAPVHGYETIPDRAGLNQLCSIFEWIDGKVVGYLNALVVILICVVIFMVYFVINAFQMFFEFEFDFFVSVLNICLNLNLKFNLNF